MVSGVVLSHSGCQVLQASLLLPFAGNKRSDEFSPLIVSSPDANLPSFQPKITGNKSRGSPICSGLQEPVYLSRLSSLFPAKFVWDFLEQFRGFSPVSARQDAQPLLGTISFPAVYLRVNRWFLRWFWGVNVKLRVPALAVLVFPANFEFLEDLLNCCVKTWIVLRISSWLDRPWWTVSRLQLDILLT